MNWTCARASTGISERGNATAVDIVSQTDKVAAAMTTRSKIPTDANRRAADSNRERGIVNARSVARMYEGLQSDSHADAQINAIISRRDIGASLRIARRRTAVTRKAEAMVIASADQEPKRKRDIGSSETAWK